MSRRSQFTRSGEASRAGRVSGRAGACVFEGMEDRRLMASHAVAGDFGPKTPIATGQSVELFLDVVNIGDEAYTDEFIVSWQLSEDDSLSEDDDVILTEVTRTDVIAAGATVRVAQTVTIPAVVPGAYKLLVQVRAGTGFSNVGTDAAILGVETDFRIGGLDVSPHTLNLREAFRFEWSADISNRGLSRALAKWDAILSRDRKIGNGDDVVLEGDGLPFLDLQVDQTGILSDFESIIGSAMPSGSYYLGVRVTNGTDPTPANNIAVSAKPVISVIGESLTDGVVTMLGGGGLNAIITNDVAALRSNGTGFGPVEEDGGFKTITYAIRNDGSQPLDIFSVEARGQHPQDFTISNTFPMTLAAGQTQTYTITFDPTDFANRRANMRFTTSDPNRETFRMRIAGKGEAPATAPDIAVFGRPENTGAFVEIEQNDGSPRPEDGTDMGAELVNVGTETREFEIRNTGQATLEFRLSPDGVSAIRGHSGEAANTFAFGPENAANRGFLVGIPGSLDAGESLTLRITFAPLGLGKFKPWIEIYTNDPDEPMFRFKVKGIGSLA